jgi:hypothetical protein
MNAIPATITPTLSRLIALLGSDRSGEVIAAVSAIGRVLASSGADFHDLARAIAPTADTDDWRDVLAFCAVHADTLDDRDREFLATVARYRNRPSEKQLKWLHGIAARLRGEQ